MSIFIVLGKLLSNNMSKRIYFKKGFTLIELITALAIFMVIMTISMGSIIGIFDASRKSRTLKTVMNNLNFAMETMSKEMRFGKTYHCGPGNIAVPQNCPSGDTLMSFSSSEGDQIIYRLNQNRIEKQINGVGYTAVTAPEAVIESLQFYTLGADTSDSLQAKVLIKITGYAGADKNRSDFTLQTLVSQRLPDL